LSSPRVVLRLSDVVKTFPGVVALKGVSLEVIEGEVHALVGENGAGKSTLIAVAAGSTLPDSGIVEIGGVPVTQPSPAAAQALGLAVVYQQRAILDDLTVAENMVVAMPSGSAPRLVGAAQWIRAKLAATGVTIDPAARISELSVPERQLLDIAKALALEPKVLVLDEPTESLAPADADRLFEQIRAITAAGTAVVYISHRLPEIQRIADRITVLRDGETRGTMAAADVSEEQILNLIIGRSVDQAFPAKGIADATRPPLLETDGLSGPRFHDVTLQVRPGEIVGLAGVEGNGQGEFLRALAGLLPSHGPVRLRGEVVSLSDPTRAHASGLVLMPGDRRAEGVFHDLSVRENVSPLILNRIARRGIVRRAAESRVVAREIEQMAIKTPSPETPVSALSGGNQQKVVFARALLAQPTVLLANEPTRGVDAGARLEIYQLLREAAESGQAVLVLSSDVIELQGLCDRVHVFSRGTVVQELAGDDITEENITGATITAAGPGSDRAAPPARAAGAALRVLRVRRMRRFVAGDYLPAAVLLLLILGLGIYTSASNGRFLTEINFQGMLLLASALALISFGQLIVLLTGAIDLSVGPLSGLVVVVFSFFATEGQSTGRLVLGVLAVIGVALAVGLINSVLVRVFGIAAVLATLATYIAIQGESLALRPQPAGYLRASVTGALTKSWGWIPVAFLIVCALAIGAELMLRLTRAGLQLRAVGSDDTIAHRLGARVNRTHIAAYVLCSLFASAGGLMLASQVGVGDATVGVSYTLTSITAVVLGGASIFGGRGSFIGALFGAVLLQEIITSTTFLNLGAAWQSFLFGGLILVGACTYSRARRARAGALGVEHPD
jgi:ribose transport system ATP-binding protein